MSEHYPTALELLVDPAATAVAMIPASAEAVNVANPVGNRLSMRFTKGLEGKTIAISCVDALGRIQMNTQVVCSGETMQLPFQIAPGIYYLRFVTDDHIISEMSITKK